MVDQRQLPNFAETQDNSNQIFGPTVIDSVLRVQSASPFGISPISSSRLKGFTPQVLIDVAKIVPLKRSRESTPDSKDRKFRKRDSTPKLRHDDSQIQFETIESSPIGNGTLDSQLLTERQKEVKERQQAEAAMFPDLRSSPRRRENSRPSPSSDLPLRRSESRSRTKTSPVLARRTTPTEYDDYVNSSPTPTRALQPGGMEVDLPSSPPEAANEHIHITPYLEDEADIPSSPPEMPQAMETETTTSLDPSAQVDHYAEEKQQTLSTVESRQPTDSTDLVAQAGGDECAADSETSVATAGHTQPSPMHEPSTIEESAFPDPGTPIRGRESSAGVFQTPRSETFHDAQTSPASSDKPMTEDVFEEAYSSPRLNLAKADKQRASSPLSYLDESSAMRLLAGYDQEPDPPRRSPRKVGFAIGEEIQSEAFSTTSPKAIPHPSSWKQSERAEDESGPVLRRTKEVFDKGLSSLIEEATNLSPMPSLIPETPGPKAAKNLQVVDGDQIDMNETIVVDDSILYQQSAPTVKRRKRKSDVNEIPASKKGTLREVVAESSETPASQDAKSESEHSQHTFPLRSTHRVTVVSLKKTSPKKRRRGRPKRVSSLAQDGTQDSFSQSFSSVDEEGSVQGSQGVETATEVAARSAKAAIVSGADEAMIEQTSELAQTVEVVLHPNNEEPRLTASHDEEREYQAEAEKTDSAINHGVNTSDTEMVADTIIGEGSSAHHPSSASSKPEAEVQALKEVELREDDVVMEEAEIIEKAVMSTSKILTMSVEPMNQILPAQMDASVSTEKIAEVPSAQGVKDKLQSIIGDLGTVALSRNDLNDLEDLFMDAKQLLYGAGRRGRAGS